MRQTERRAETRKRLIGIARAQFGAKGFDQVSTDEIVREAGFTRGALYHQFNGKQGLFEAVVEAIQQEIGAGIGARADAKANPWGALIEGSLAFLDFCAEPDVQQIVLIDAPVVLGWQRWREIDEHYGFGELKLGLEAAIDSGDLRPQPILPLAHLLAGAMNELALWLAREEDRTQASEEARTALIDLMEGLRTTPQK